MDPTEHKLVTLAEEASELAKAALKAARFGLDDRKTTDPNTINRDPNTPTNAERIVDEFNDLVGAYKLVHWDLIQSQAFPLRIPFIDEDKTRAKVERIQAFMRYAERVGALDYPRTITLTRAGLQAALDMLGEDPGDGAEFSETEITLAWRGDGVVLDEGTDEGCEGGIYAFFTEYPEEGCALVQPERKYRGG